MVLSGCGRARARRGAAPRRRPRLSLVAICIMASWRTARGRAAAAAMMMPISVLMATTSAGLLAAPPPPQPAAALLPPPAVSVTPAPCSGKDPSRCPYYWNPVQDTYYEVAVGGQPSFVYQAETPAKCKTGPINCARGWNVQSQSFTLASASFGGGQTIEVHVSTRRGRLSNQPFKDPRVISRFGQGSPTESSRGASEFSFKVTSAGHYSVELFGQGDGLRDALLIFIDALKSTNITHHQDVESGEELCPSPIGTGKLHHFTGPNSAGRGLPSWLDTGYYAFDALSVGPGDVICVERGAWVEGHVAAAHAGCNDHQVSVVGQGVWSGQAILGKVPTDDRRPLIQLCGANISVTGLTLVNALAANLELTPYWAPGYHSVFPGEMRRLRGGNRAHNIKVLSTWWYSTDGIIAGPWGEVSDSFVMVNDDSLKPMQRGTKVRDCTVWQGDNGWSIMFGWNAGTNEAGMSVQNIHILHVGHWADGYCYPCSAHCGRGCGCHGGSSSAGAGRGYCGGKKNTSSYGGYRAVIGAIWGEPGSLSGVSIDNIRVSGPYWRAVSLASTWNLFGNNPVGSVHNWVFGNTQSVVFEQPQHRGIRSKIWATGSGVGRGGTVSNIVFSNLSIGGSLVRGSNHETYFQLAQQCTPRSVLDQNVLNISFAL
jgi:hypothetical protein